MEERQYPTLEEKLAQKKAQQKEEKRQQRLIKKASPEEKKKRAKKMVVFLVVLATLFCLSFTATSFIIINANRLTYDMGNKNELTEYIKELEKELEEKNAEIERLSVNSSAPSFSAPVVQTVTQPSNNTKKEETKKQTSKSDVKTPPKPDEPKTETKEEAPAELSNEEVLEPSEEIVATRQDDDVVSELEGILN